MRKIVSIISFLAFSTMLFAGNYNMDKTHTNVEFSVTHMVISTVSGEFQEFDIDLNLDLNDLENASVTAVIKTASVLDVNNSEVDDAGDIITYTIVVSNTGYTTVNSLTLDDKLSGSVTAPKANLY